MVSLLAGIAGLFLVGVSIVVRLRMVALLGLVLLAAGSASAVVGATRSNGCENGVRIVVSNGKPTIDEVLEAVQSHEPVRHLIAKSCPIAPLGIRDPWG